MSTFGQAKCTSWSCLSRANWQKAKSNQSIASVHIQWCEMDGCGRWVGVWNSRCVRLLPAGLGFVVHVAGFARQARPQSRPRYFWAQSETQVRPCCPHLNRLGRGGPESFARLAMTRVPLVATLGLELNILGEKLQALERRGRRDQLRC
jgi:hypothetical protein